MDNAYVKFLQLPSTVKAYVVANADMTYTIVLNSALSREQNVLSYAHELDHIRNGDYDRKCSADLIELYSHEY